MIDAVLSWHLNPMTCGVAKFNQQLAKRLAVPCYGLNWFYFPEPVRHPLLSVKASEVPEGTLWPEPPFDVLWHDAGIQKITALATRVFYATQTGCPSTIDGNPTRGAYRVLTFGMAHKLALPHFEALKVELDREHPDYTISLSTAVHEGSPWDEALIQSTEAMRGIFGDRLRVLGFLGDDALARELVDCDAVAAYFTPALRANNTSAWAAIDAGKHLYTNTDAASPPLTMDHSWARLTALIQGVPCLK